MNNSRRTSLGQTMAQMRQQYQARSAQSNAGRYSPSSPSPPSSPYSPPSNIKLTLVGPNSVTRGDTATFIVTVHPSELSPAPKYKWESTIRHGKKEITISKDSNASSTWEGIIVISSSIKVTVTINEQEFTRTKYIRVKPRLSWRTPTSYTLDKTNFGSATPKATEIQPDGTPEQNQHGLGRAKGTLKYKARNLKAAEVPSGPNQGFKYMAAHDITGPFKVEMNKHFYMTKNIPQSWIDFRKAQGNEAGEVSYKDIEPAVLKHEGVEEDLETHSHWTDWRDKILKVGNANHDPVSQIEAMLRYNETTTQLKQDAISFLTEFIRWLPTARREAGEPSSYLPIDNDTGKRKKIDFTYPDPPNQNNQDSSDPNPDNND